jgi:pimeloyl-ACP methyl ester carboxylesterase
MAGWDAALPLGEFDLGRSEDMRRLGACILLLAMVAGLAVCPASGSEPVIETGEIDGAPFRIQIPAQWNRGLVVYAHGYLPAGAKWSPLHEIFTSIFLDRGFALIESGYTSQGWAVKEGIGETEALRQYFVRSYGEPELTLITGHSMGGLITVALIETYPDAYDGALPMCAPLVPAALFFRDSVFDMLVTFEALFGEGLPEELRPVIDAPALTKEGVTAALDSDSAMAEAFACHWGLRREGLADIVTLYHLLYREVRMRCGGNPIDNMNTVYSGFGGIEGLNQAVPRYAADPGAFEYLEAYYTPTGLIEDPVVAIHTTYDPGVSPRWTNSYSMTAALKGTDDWFVQHWVEAEGHCNIDPTLIAQAFDELRAWVTEGIRPKPGLLR